MKKRAIYFLPALMSGLFLTNCTSPTSSTSNHSYKPIGSIERIDPSFDSIVSKDAQPEIVADTFVWAEGPVWIADQKMVLFSDIPPNKIYKWTEAGGKELYLTPSGYTDTIKRGGEVGSNALLVHDGKLVLCQHGDRRMAFMDATLQNPMPKYVSIADHFDGKRFNSPNDAVFRSNGDLFFTDPPYGLEKNMDDPHKEIKFQGVYKVTPQGKVTLLLDSITRPNGIAFTSDEKDLIVSNSDGDRAIWYMYKFDKNDSLVSDGILYNATAEGKKEQGGPDGIKVDRHGNIFATGPGGIWIFNKDRKLLGKIKMPVRCSNIALADDDKTIFITASMNLVRVKLRN
jgi:gluconolactonase